MRKLVRLISVIIAVSIIATTVLAAESMYEGYRIINVMVDGKPLVSDVPAVNLNGRTVLPLRVVAESAGMDVQWDPATNTATLTSREDPEAATQRIVNNTLSNDLATAKKSLETALNDLNLERQKKPPIDTTLQEANSQLTKDLAAANAKVTTLQAELDKAKAAVVPTVPAVTTPVTPPAPAPVSTGFKTVAELKTHLDNNYKTISTAAGTITLRYIFLGPNDDKGYPWDYSVSIFWEPFGFFLDLDSRISITPAMKSATLATLRDHAKLVYELMNKTFPGKKLEGQYLTVWYDYPSIREGIHTMRHFTWQNYDEAPYELGVPTYSRSTLGAFRFTQDN